MSTISFSLPVDGSTADVADYNVPLTTIKNAINGGLDNTNIKAGAGITANKISGLNPTAFSNPYKFSVYQSVAQSIGAGATVRVAYDTKLFDTSTNVDVATNKGRFTAVTPGFYQFNAGVTFGPINGNTGGAIFIYKNGAAATLGASFEIGTSTYQPGLTVNSFLQLTTTDYVEVFYYNGDSVARLTGTGSAYTYFTGYMVSAT